MKNSERIGKIHETAQQLKELAEDLWILTQTNEGELEHEAYQIVCLAQHLQTLSAPTEAHKLAMKLQAQGFDVDIVSRYPLKQNKNSKLPLIAYC